MAIKSPVPAAAKKWLSAIAIVIVIATFLEAEGNDFTLQVLTQKGCHLLCKGRETPRRNHTCSNRGAMQEQQDHKQS